MKLLLLSGPPSSGKDTIAKDLYHAYCDDGNIVIGGFIFERFSMPLKTSFSAITNTRHNAFYENDVYEKKKDEVISWLGCSYRQYQINLSEKHFKPLYGEDIFARMLYGRLQNYSKDYTVVVPDLGFEIETEYLYNNLPQLEWKTDVLVIRCHRKGYDFSNDSRSYIYTDKFKSIDINNNGTQEAFEIKGENIFKSFMRSEDCAKYNEPVEA